jgi:SnoaL-like domain
LPHTLTCPAARAVVRVTIAMAGESMTERQLRHLLAEYLTLLQRHPSAEEMMTAVVTEDFETGFVDGVRWKGIEGLREFLSQREGFFDEHHEVKDLLETDSPSPDEVHAKTRLEFFLRRWDAPSPTSEEFTGSCFHTWRLRREPDRWRVAAQIVDHFADLNDNSKRLFATPDEGLNR